MLAMSFTCLETNAEIWTKHNKKINVYDIISFWLYDYRVV